MVNKAIKTGAISRYERQSSGENGQTCRKNACAPYGIAPTIKYIRLAPYSAYLTGLHQQVNANGPLQKIQKCAHLV